MKSSDLTDLSAKANCLSKQPRLNHPARTTMQPNTSSLQHLDDYRRYGRQMILDEFGLPGPRVYFLACVKKNLTVIPAQAN